MTQNGEGEKYDVYVLRGLGYGGEEVWDPVGDSQEVSWGEAKSIGENIKNSKMVAAVVPNEASPFSYERKVFQ